MHNQGSSGQTVVQRTWMLTCHCLLVSNLLFLILAGLYTICKQCFASQDTGLSSSVFPLHIEETFPGIPQFLFIRIASPAYSHQSLARGLRVPPWIQTFCDSGHLWFIPRIGQELFINPYLCAGTCRKLMLYCSYLDSHIGNVFRWAPYITWRQNPTANSLVLGSWTLPTPSSTKFHEP